jgi:putative ABC transport system substrate-binding protein
MPLAAHAQQPDTPVIGFLSFASLAPLEYFVAGFRQGLKETGFVEGQNIAVEYRSAEGQINRLQPLAAELAGRRVGVLVTIGGEQVALAAKATTATIPIVFNSGGDPVKAGIVASMNRPGGNATGVSFLVGVVGAKRLELLHQLAPKATTIAALVDPDSPTTTAERTDLSAAAQAMGLRLPVFNVGSGREIETAIASAVQGGARALFVGGGGLLNSERDRLVALAARHKLPASFIVRETVVAGGLMSYGPSQTDAYRQAGGYVARILKGEKPADLPVMQAAKFEFVLNLTTAKTLGLAVSPAVLALADEVVE